MKKIPPPVGEYLYRIHDGHGDIFKAYSYSRCHDTETFLFLYKVIGITQHGAWIAYGNDKKFVLLDARKKFACENIELAKESFLRRKARQIKFLNAYINRIHDAVAHIDRAGYLRITQGELE